MADQLTIKVVSGTSEALHLSVDVSSCSVLALKQLIQQQDARRFPVAAQRLIFQGQILQDAKLLSDYHVASGCALHLTLTPGAVAAANAAVDREAAPAAPAQLRVFLQQMRESEAPEQYATAVRTLQKVCANIVAHPTEEKYRKLRVDNAALKAKLFERTRGQDCAKLLGFQAGVAEGHLVLVPTPERWENLVACKAVVDGAVTVLGRASPLGAAPAGMGMGGDFAAQAQTLLQNPAMLQAMTNNPMVQQMAQQNPMLAQALQNPALLAQSVQALQQNPAMMQQINQMMSDPNAMARMQQMMAGGGMGGLGGFGGSPFGTAPPSTSAANPFAPSPSTANPFASAPAAPYPMTSAPSSTPAPAAAPAPAQPATTSSTAATSSSTAAATSSDNNDETFEEDEIAKAIARSLQDQ